jgi:Ca2+-binding RTX toxin-like protein
MPTWTFSPPQPGEGGNLPISVFALFGQTDNLLTSTSLRYFGADDFNYLFHGKNIAFSDPGTGIELVSGRISSLDLKLQGSLILTVTGWNFSAAIFHEAIGANNALTVVTLMLGGADTMIGTRFGDSLSGGAGADRLFGGRGQDDLQGDPGRDALFGGAAADDLRGDEDDDRLFGGGAGDSLQGGTGNDLLSGDAAGDAMIGGTGNDRLFGGTGEDALSGEDGNDRLFGGSGNDVLYGGNGNDTLNGGAGSDTMIGLNDADVFVFDAALGPANVDFINGFEVGSDRIQLDNDVFKTLGPPGALAPGRLRLGTVAEDGNDRIIYNPATGRVWYDADGAGGAGKVAFLLLTPMLALTAADFVIVG